MYNDQLIFDTLKSQQSASNPHNSVFLSSSAGSGKTKVLTDRVLRLLLLEFSPSKILCLTFTKVAASEMQHRIYKELGEFAVLEEDQLVEKLFKLTGSTPSATIINNARKLFALLLESSDGIKISTIHSFCQSLIKRFPIEAKINPHFEIIDDQIADKLLLEAKKLLLEKALNNESLSSKIKNITSNLNEDSFLNIIGELLQKRDQISALKDQYFDIQGVIEKIYQTSNCHLEDSEEKLLAKFYEDKNFDKASLLFLAKTMEEFGSKTDQLKKQNIIDFISDPSLENFSKYRDVFLTQKSEPQKRITTKDVIVNFENAEELLLQEQSRVLFFDEKLTSFKIAKSTADLLFIADQMLEIYGGLKAKNSYLDYNDLIIKTNQLLQNPQNSEWIKYKLDGGVNHILIDESQDTNHFQWNIIKAISDDFFTGSSAIEKNRTIFIVGDEKQSIYKFQGADPKIFGDIFYYYQEKLSAIGKKIYKIELDNSFRSCEAILKAVDLTFAGETESQAISKLKTSIKHTPIRNKNFGKVELMPIINYSKAVNKDKTNFNWELDFSSNEESESKSILARIIVKTIQEWINNKKTITDKKGQTRLLKYSDIMILIRNRTNNLGNLLIKYFEEEKIPVCGKDKVDLIKNIIVQDLLALAKFILLPEDDLNLAGLLKSPIIGLDEDELLQLCLVKNQENIDLISAVKKSKSPKIQEKYYFLQDLIDQNHILQNQFYDFFSYLLETRNIKNKIKQRFGKQSDEILDQFLLLCLSLQENKINSLEELISTAENLDLSIKIDLGSESFNEIKITTIHKSKGLEAPIIFLADTIRSTKNKYANDWERIFWADEAYSFLPFWPNSLSNNIVKNIKEKKRKIDDEEYLRQLYVAMTRAENELYVAGFGSDIDDGCWYELIKKGISQEAKNKNYDFNKILKEENQDYLIGEGLVLERNDHSQSTNIEPEEVEEIKLPNFINTKLTEEHSELIYPSKLYNSQEYQVETNKQSANYGKIIHKILEIIPDIKIDDEDKKRSLITNYLKNSYSLKEEEVAELISQVFNIINNPEYRYLFESNSKSEVPIIAKINGKLISGKIDRLVIGESEVVIIDYKTARNIPKEIPESYKKQLELYQKIISNIYPNKKIKCAVIWTSQPRIDFLD